MHEPCPDSWLDVNFANPQICSHSCNGAKATQILQASGGLIPMCRDGRVPNGAKTKSAKRVAEVNSYFWSKFEKFLLLSSICLFQKYSSKQRMIFSSCKHCARLLCTLHDCSLPYKQLSFYKHCESFYVYLASLLLHAWPFVEFSQISGLAIPQILASASPDCVQYAELETLSEVYACSNVVFITPCANKTTCHISMCTVCTAAPCSQSLSLFFAQHIFCIIISAARTFCICFHRRASSFPISWPFYR